MLDVIVNVGLVAGIRTLRASGNGGGIDLWWKLPSTSTNSSSEESKSELSQPEPSEYSDSVSPSYSAIGSNSSWLSTMSDSCYGIFLGLLNLRDDPLSLVAKMFLSNSFLN